MRPWIAVLASALVLTACGGSTAGPPASGSGAAIDGPSADGRLVVATTVSPLTSIVAAVGGKDVTIEGIVPEGVNSHTFEPAPQAAELLSKADIVFVNGLKLEDPTVELARTNLKEGGEVFEIGSTVLPESDYIYDFSFPQEEGKPNPHLWTDPLYAIAYADAVRGKLSERDPAHAANYQANYEVFAANATALADALRADQATVPRGGLKLVTYHDAYAYFAKDFGWKVIGAIQPKTFDDPTPQEIADLIAQIKAEGVQTIFGSEVFPSSVLEAIAAETGVKYEDSLRDDDLPGVPGEAQHTLLELLRYDYRTMIAGLGGTPTHLDALVFDTSVPDEATYPQ